MKRLRWIALTGLIVSVSCHIGCAYEMSGYEKREIEKITSLALKFLKEFKPSPEAKELTLKKSPGGFHVEFGYDHYKRDRSHGGEFEGLLRLGKDQWVYLVVSTNHSSPVTNVVFAVDQDGNLYRMRTHVCPVLELESEKKALDSAAAFFETRSPDNDQSGKRNAWEKLERQ